MTLRFFVCSRTSVDTSGRKSPLKSPGVPHQQPLLYFIVLSSFCNAPVDSFYTTRALLCILISFSLDILSFISHISTDSSNLTFTTFATKPCSVALHGACYYISKYDLIIHYASFIASPHSRASQSSICFRVLVFPDPSHREKVPDKSEQTKFCEKKKGTQGTDVEP
jgi:hypothetical protein